MRQKPRSTRLSQLKNRTKNKKEPHRRWKTRKILKRYLEFRYCGTFHLRTDSIPFSLRSLVTDSNVNPRSCESRGPEKKGGRGDGVQASFSPCSEINLAPLACPTWLASHTQVTAARTAQGREAGRNPSASYLRCTAASSRLEKKSLEARARRGEARPPRRSRGLPQRPPSSRHRSGHATAPSRQHHLILRGCSGPAPPGRREGGGRPARSPTSLRG